MAITDFKQTDPRWNTRPYAGENINNAGCGPTSAADILAALANVSPPDVADWMQAHGFASDGFGTYWEGIPAGIRAFGGECRQLIYSSMLGVRTSGVFDAFVEHLRSGYCGVMLMGNGGSPIKWTNGGHYIAAVGYGDGQILIYDPASILRTGWHPWADFIPSIKILYTTNIQSVTVPFSYAYKFDMGWIHGEVDGFRMSTGKRVELLQRVWQSFGWYKGSIDGKFEAGSRDAAILCQKLHNLEPDGSAGYDTQRATFRLRSEYRSGKYVFYTHEIQKGSSGESVILAQSILRSWGSYYGAIDGDFGEQTDAAVRKWQQSHGLKVDGQCGPATWKSLIGF